MKKNVIIGLILGFCLMPLSVKAAFEGEITFQVAFTGGDVKSKAQSGMMMPSSYDLLIKGNQLKVNMDASARGWLKVEILDESGHALWGFEKSAADRLMFNDLAQTASWNGNPDVSSLQGRSVRLRFIGQSVKLFSFCQTTS